MAFNMFHSKRFIAFAVAVILFILMVYTTHYAPLELASSISIITGIYIAGQTFRGSTTEK